MHHPNHKQTDKLERKVRRAELARIKAEREEFENRNPFEFEGDGEYL